MIPISHALSGFLVIAGLSVAGLIEATTFHIAYGVVVSVIPDIDSMWSTRLNTHHSSILHTPFLWTILSVLLIPFNAELALITGTCGVFHVFADYLTALTTGVELLQPFSDMDFHLYDLQPEAGNFNPTSPSADELKSFLLLYQANKHVLVIELAIIVLSLISLMFLI
jgi:hypothetical protein